MGGVSEAKEGQVSLKTKYNLFFTFQNDIQYLIGPGLQEKTINVVTAGARAGRPQTSADRSVIDDSY